MREIAAVSRRRGGWHDVDIAARVREIGNEGAEVAGTVGEAGGVGV